jgi:hypothetical protein
MMIFPRLPEETKAEYEMLWKSGIITWHCREGRHGTILNIKPEHVNKLYAMLCYFLGKKCGWQKINDDGTISLEFVYQGNGRLDKPWLYCNKSVLFEDWHKRDDEYYTLADQFHLGDNVKFDYKGNKYKGILINKRKRGTILSGGQKYYIPFTDMEKV